MDKFYKDSYKILIAILLLVLLFLFRFESPIIDKISNYGSVIILILGIFLIVSSIRLGIVSRLGKEVQQIMTFWFITAGWMLIVPIIFFNYKFNAEVFYQGMFHDYRYIVFSILPFFFITNDIQVYYEKILKYSSWVALFFGIIAIIIVDKSFSSVASRDSTTSLSYFYWWLVTMLFPYWFLRFYYLGKDKVGLFLLLINVVLSIFFLKRSGFLNTLLIMALAFITSKFNFRSLVFIIISLVGFLGIIYFYLDLFELLLFRFFGEVDDLEDWDRNLEIKEFFDNVKNFELFTGFGVNNYLNMLYVGQTEEGVNSLHIGIYNIVYKGGLLYSIFMIYLAVKILSLFKYISQNIEIKIAFVIGVYSMIGLFYEGGWSYLPSVFFIMLPIFRGIYLKDKLLNEKNYKRK